MIFNILENNSNYNKQYGVPEEKKFPLDSKAHVRFAIKFFNYVKPEYEEELARNIKKKIKEYDLNISIGDNNRLKRYLNEVLSESADFDNINTPENLSVWMKKNISYWQHDDSNVESYEEVLSNKKGDCYDQVEFEKVALNSIGIRYSGLYLIEYKKSNPNQGYNTHALLYYKKDGKYYWFENAWELYQGIHEYDSLNELKDDLFNKWDFSNGCDRLLITNLGKVKPGISHAEYVYECTKSNNSSDKVYNKGMQSQMKEAVNLDKEETALNAINPIVGTNVVKPYVAVASSGGILNTKKYGLSSDLISDKYLVIDEDKNNESYHLEITDASFLTNGEFEIYEYIGNRPDRMTQIYQAYKENKSLYDPNYIYTCLSGKKLLSEDQIEFDSNFKKVNLEQYKDKIESMQSTLSAGSDDIYFPVLEGYNDVNINPEIKKYDYVSFREDMNGFYAVDTLTSNRTKSVKNINDITESMILSLR